MHITLVEGNYKQKRKAPHYNRLYISMLHVFMKSDAEFEIRFILIQYSASYQ
ncbi:predicted protein [Brucella abortus bv. 4 str. 292]|uniref:Uncharacterized protein n=12 Tax=Brucella TaxID=234 RepID=Q2YN13_BRUA2|nr:hypothetical protein BruAb1_0667 [Brucella abortus bv. 1 str. 9-941]ABX61737.1 Hypothetical protein, conserved [Brucella canis ATCC 23365]ABY37756.1 Hypothetical protein, conserved [Brucella suis ATCC 23445]ACD72158.1 hypothetical protein BAbS19_I06270 [Brucella abortus S19]ACO00450.1 Hypothetical protein, conserved [Brucella melitensis ATCC 23457]ACU47647.1 hypothetical protein BMI_I649 [Brucella microti CCM 4915]AEK53981.1 hypothetical protein BPI_I685 [Brucella pinnipedialis B2/94]AIB2